MAFFDATLFTVIPRLYRALDAALDPPTGRAPRPGLGQRPDGDAAATRRAVPAARAAGSAGTATATRA